MIRAVASLLALAMIMVPREVNAAREDGAEVGGRVVQISGAPLSTRATVRFCADDFCVSSVETGDQGYFTAQLPAGSYTMIAEVAGIEVGREQLELEPGCWRHDISVYSPLIDVPPLAVLENPPPSPVRSG